MPSTSGLSCPLQLPLSREAFRGLQQPLCLSVSDCVQPVEIETSACSWGRLSACGYVCSSMSLACPAHLVSAAALGSLLRWHGPGAAPSRVFWGNRSFSLSVQRCQAVVPTGSWTASYWPSLLDTSLPVLPIIRTGSVVMRVLSRSSVFFRYEQGVCSGFELFPTSISHSLEFSFPNRKGGARGTKQGLWVCWGGSRAPRQQLSQSLHVPSSWFLQQQTLLLPSHKNFHSESRWLLPSSYCSCVTQPSWHGGGSSGLSWRKSDH